MREFMMCLSTGFMFAFFFYGVMHLAAPWPDCQRTWIAPVVFFVMSIATCVASVFACH